MGIQVVNLATLQCTFGMAPGTLMVLPANCTLGASMPSANIMDHIPMVNIMPFGMCQSPSNPTVAAATAAGPRRAKPVAPCPRRRWASKRPSSGLRSI